MSIQLINTGGSAAEGISVAIGGGGPSAFSVSAPGCVPSLAAGASCNISVQVTAQSPGGQQATLEVQSSNGGDAPYLILQAQVGWKVGLFVSAAAATLTVTPPIPLWSCSGYCGDSSCTGQECSGSVFDGTPEQFSLSLPSGEGVQWTSPPCGYFPSPMCSFTVNADKAVNAQVGPLVNLNVTRLGFANDLPYGLVALGPPGVVSTDWCVGTCPFVWFGPLMLDAVLQSGEDPDSAVLLQWGDACADAGPSCQLDVDAGLTVTANFQPVNSVFTTGPLPLASFGSDGSGADSACNTAASSKGYGGTFVAWLASTGRNPAQLLAGSNGWGGVSGNASPIFAPDIQALAGARPWAPLISTSTPTVTGAAVDGTPLPASETCNNWTSTTGVTPAGTTGAMGYAWSNDLGAPPVACSGSANIVCFGTGASGLVITSRFLDAGTTFLSTPWVPSDGVLGADSQCQADASDAGWPGTFVASELRGIPIHDGDVRADGAPVETADNITSHGVGLVPNTLSDTYVWTSGSPDCSGWQGGSGQVGRIRRFDLGATALVPSSDLCTRAHPIVCLRTP